MNSINVLKKGLFLMLFMLATSVIAQNKNAKAVLEVDGVCGMCKQRIEKAAIRTKGVKSAVWSVETHELKLIFDANKTNTEVISKNLAAVGHDTKFIKATDEAYNSVNPCCRYRDEAVVKAHDN